MPRPVNEKVNLRLSNRDGQLMLVRSNGTYWLVLEADSCHLTPQFDGLGSVEAEPISEVLFLVLKSELQESN